MNAGESSPVVVKSEQLSSLAGLQPVTVAAGFTLHLKPEDYITKLLQRDGVFEAPETDLVTRILRAGDTCIDAGCHVGYYTCLFAQLVGPAGRVYAFDANPESCLHTSRNLTANHLGNVEVIQAALADERGSATFYVSTDDQTGLSSLAPIPRHKEAIVVPRLRLRDFLRERHISKVRLLKLDVEGAEELVLKGLGRFLTDRRIDFILMECYDERLGLLNSSTETVAALLRGAGYQCWEFGTVNPSGWSLASEVRSRGDANYLFGCPSPKDGVPAVSVVGACLLAQAERDELARQLQSERQAWEANLAKAQNDITFLMGALHKGEEEATRLRLVKAELEVTLDAIAKSPGWRLLNVWRRVRDQLAPESTRRRRLYGAVLNRLRKGGGESSG